jgi:membrane protein DedA with SNARE-associated domain
MVEQFDSWARALGPFGPLAFALAAFLEYVFPPFPGDTVTLLAGVFAVRGEASWALVFVAVTAGSVLGAAVDYAFGRLIATRVEKQPDGKLFFWISHARIHQAQAKMRAKGVSLLLVNRFLPAMRSIIFVAAGAARMPARQVLGYGALSAMAWNVLIMGAGLAVGGNLQRVEALFEHYQRGAIALLVIAALGFGVRTWLKRRPARGAAP